MRRDVATIICVVVFIFAAGLGMVPGATQYAVLTAQAGQERNELASLQRHNQELPGVERELAAYRAVFASKLSHVTEQHAAAAFAQTTLVLARKYRVGFGQQTLAGPLAAPTPIAVNPSLTGGPTPPPTPPPVLGATVPGAVVTPMPAVQLGGTDAKIVGFAAAMNVTNDPWARPLLAFAGSIDLVGSYPDLIAALQDMSRETAFVRVMRATMCRAENDPSAKRTLTIVFRLYGLADPVGAGPKT